ncbi:6-bladed beta-propeller [Roseivirga pacifica]|uniref:6-bladed beta-propeller n=1 Tax=Roseivirga pacifica TaxID=1267423 RepID=UPI00227B5D0D|nr:6-bladed beta-propeller [Roseivirga pacifica]
MKISHTGILAIALTLWCSSCEQTPKEESFQVINISPTETSSFELESIIDSTEEIKLEETDESLIGNITKLERTDEFIFVFDARNQKIMQFDRSGKYIKSIGKIGEGPEEIAMPTTFTVDAEKRHIYIGGMRKIVVYDFEGNFVRYFSGFNIPTYMYVRDNALEVFRTETQKVEGTSGYYKIPTRYRIDTSTGNIIDSLQLNKASIDKQMMFLVTDANYYSETSKGLNFYLTILFPEPLVRDTLYNVAGTELTPSLKLDFGKEALTEDGSRAISIRSIFRSDRYLLAKYFYQNKQHHFFYDLKQQKGYNIKGELNDEHYGDDPIRIYPIAHEANTFYFYQKKLEEGQIEEPNPTIYFVKLKP